MPGTEEELTQARTGGTLVARSGHDEGAIATEPSILTVKETDELLRVSRQVVCGLVRAKRLPALGLGSRTRISRRGLVAFMGGMDANRYDALIHRRAEQR